MSGCPEHSSVCWASSGPRDPGCLHLSWEQLQKWTADSREKAGHWTGRVSTQMLGAAPQLVPGHRSQRPWDSRDADFLQVALSEGQKDAEVHVLLLKHLQVFEAANLLQQCGEVLEGEEPGQVRRQAGHEDVGAGKGLCCTQSCLSPAEHLACPELC